MLPCYSKFADAGTMVVELRRRIKCFSGYKIYNNVKNQRSTKKLLKSGHLFKASGTKTGTYGFQSQGCWL